MTKQVSPPEKEDYIKASTADVLKLYKGSIFKMAKIGKSPEQVALHRLINVLEKVLLERCPNATPTVRTTPGSGIDPKFNGF